MHFVRIPENTRDPEKLKAQSSTSLLCYEMIHLFFFSVNIILFDLAIHM